MAAIVRPTASQLVDLGVLVGAVPYLGAKMHLCTIDFTPTKDTVLADLVAGEANFVGYAAKTITWLGPYLDGLDNAVADAVANWIMTGALPTNICYVAYITDSASAILLASWRIDTSLNFAVVNDGATLTASITLGNGTAIQVP